MKMKKRILSIVLVIILCIGLLPTSVSAAASADDIVIFYTNDIHTYIEKDITYSLIAALKDSCENALLVDAGDHIQGTAAGDMDDGETIIKLMNAADYDLATLGNHEFDYTQAGRIKVTDEWSEFDYVSCNFCHANDGVIGETVLDSYKLFDVNGTTIAFVGITTPETFTSSSPTYFQDSNGSYIYGIAGGADGSALYEAVQSAVDSAKREGADYVIALGHLGIDISSAPWRSIDVIKNTCGLDAFIDGHSHTTVPMEKIPDKNGNTVILTQTGSYFDTVGKLVIGTDGELSAELLTADDLSELTPDAEVMALENAWTAEIDSLLGDVIGYSEVTLDNFDADGKRLVRKQSTNSGDFAADALYYLFDEMDIDVDAAVMNGGGIRNGAISGELTYKTCKQIHTFGNVACLLTVTGQQLLDALEWGSKELNGDGTAESGSLLHVSGVKYTLDLSFDSTVQEDSVGVWAGPPTGEYRVRDVQILNKETGKYEPLDLNAKYNLAGYNYTLRELGGGFDMLKDAVNVLDYVAEDYMVLANYIRSFPVDEETGLPTIPVESEYSDLYGSGRITIKNAASADFADTDAEAANYVLEKGLMNGTGGSNFSPNIAATRAMAATALWRLEGSPTCGQGKSGTFPDVPEYAWYTEAIEWAASVGIVNGHSNGTFHAEDPITREELAAMLYRYEQHKGGGFKGIWMFLLRFGDRADVSEWAYEAVCWMSMNGIISGVNEEIFAPKGGVTRLQMAEILMKYLELE